MAYTKTIWDNDVTAVDETNMNKIEDGLFDQDARITITEAEASGWTVLPATLTYASATRMNTSVDLTGVIGIGDKIKLTQTTVKYFYVSRVTSTYIDIDNSVLGNISVANATITNPYYSHMSVPFGLSEFGLSEFARPLLRNGTPKTGVDLNNYKTEGQYSLYGTNTNGATTTIGVLQVITYSGDWIQQVWWRIDATNECWTRMFLSGTTWTAWTKRW